MKLTGIREQVFLDRYALKDEKGIPLEKDPKDMWKRVASAVAEIEKPEVRGEWKKKFYQAMEDFKFVPGGRILSGAGSGYKVTFFNCFVIPSPKDSRGGILETLKQMVEIMARGGGVGINFSSLRPKGARVKKVNGFSSGPCNWAELFSVATKDIIQQGGCFASETKIMTHRGLIPIAEMVEGKENYFAATHKGYQKITAKFNNGKKDIYEIETRAGFKVKTTTEHKFLTFNKEGEFYLQPLKDFRRGDNLVLLLGEWLEDLPYVILNTTLSPPSKFSYGLKEVKLPKVLDENLAFLIGLYDADGSRIPDEYSENGKGLRIAVAEDRKKDLEKVINTVKSVFGLEPKIKKGDGAVYSVQVYSRQINEFLKLNKLLKESSIAATVPLAIFSSPRKVVEAYIAGVFLGDGTNRGGKGGLRICTVSEGFARDLQLLLLNLGIPAKIKVQLRKEKNWRTLYTVTVNGAMFMKKFIKILAPYTQKVSDHKISVRDGFFGWPFNVVERFIYIPKFQRTCARTNPTTSQKSVLFLQQMTPMLEEVDRVDVEFLASCVPDTISSITYVGEEKVYDLEVGEVHLLSGNGFYTSNSRRGALMLMLWDWHPDIEEFITVKRDLSRITGANLSVCVSDKFMDAVKKNEDWQLLFPDINDREYDALWEGCLDDWKKLGKKIKVYKTIKARKLWDLICETAWSSAEPGVVFLERYNKWFNNWYFNKINCVNPCGEEGLPPWGVCNLCSINLSALVKKGKIDYKKLAEIAQIGVRFQDDVIDADTYVFPQIREVQQNGERRIGLGTMGLGDALIKMKVRYGSEASLKIIEKIYKTIRDAAYEASVELACEKGAFPKFEAKKYLKGYFIKKLGKKIKESIRKHGIRNSLLLQQAPTGSTSLFAGVSSGIEPVYEFSFIRRDRLGEHRLYHSLFEEWKKTHRNEPIPSYFVSANDLSPEDHVKVQAAIQKYVDASISKTVNAPKTHTIEDVKKLYTLAYELGCKGITYMRDGSRPGVLERIGDKEKAGKKEEKGDDQKVSEIKPRPMVVQGATYQVDTPVGAAFVTINTNGNNEPLELFINVGKAGSDVTAMAEALGRLASLVLRTQSTVTPRERAKQIFNQLIGIGGSKSLGFGDKKVRSLPDAVAKVLAMHFGYKVKNGSGGLPKQNPVSSVSVLTQQALLPDLPAPRLTWPADEADRSEYDLCPSCGVAALAYEEGCKKCYNCGYSEC